MLNILAVKLLWIIPAGEPKLYIVPFLHILDLL